MKIYIAGKITGMESEALKMFSLAEAILKKNNPEAEIVNPMRLSHDHDKTWESYMKECIKELVTCTHIFALPNWKESKGAKEEVRLAKKLKIKTIMT